ncbi:hypothetical protein O9993_16010 [Vibrio lentus]|nr:hypothetical protein [Vibrio lentus]
MILIAIEPECRDSFSWLETTGNDDWPAWYATSNPGVNINSAAECIAIAIVVGIPFGIRLLDWRVNQVRMQIKAAWIPDALDLMVACVASGSTLEAVFRCVGEEMRSISSFITRMVTHCDWKYRFLIHHKRHFQPRQASAAS